MDASVGKHKRTDDKNNCTSQNPELRFSAVRKREQQRKLIGKDEHNETSSGTTIYDLPLEILDIILQKSYLHWIFNSSTKQRNEEVIRSLISVDVCFYQRIIRQRSKMAIWRYLKDFYRKTKKRSAIIRNNTNYLLENIQPNDELIASLISLSCITEEQSHFIERQCTKREKNAELLYVMRSCVDTKFSNFVKCFRRTNQKTVSRITENGGGVLKVTVQNCRKKRATFMETQLLHKKIEDLRNKNKSRSYETDKLISQLKEQGIEILNSQLDRQTVVVWIWCRSQAAIATIQRLYESKQLQAIFSCFANIRPSTSEIIQSKVINIGSNQFMKTVVVSLISVNFTQRIDIESREVVFGVTKLRNEIYVLCRSDLNVVRVFEERNPTRFQREIEIKGIRDPFDIRSSEKENCLYVSDSEGKCVWKITRETDDQHKIIKWLTTEYTPWTLSFSRDGQLLVFSYFASILMIYGTDAELVHSIQLPKDMKNPQYAVETSMGNFIILYERIKKEEEEEEEESGTSCREWETKWGVSEVTRDGQMIICRFIPSNETQLLINPGYLSLNSDDQVFVADTGDGNNHGRVILLDSDLRWNQILCPTKDEEETAIQNPRRLCYDEERKQLIVGGYLKDGVNIYTLSHE